MQNYRNSSQILHIIKNNIVCRIKIGILFMDNQFTLATILCVNALLSACGGSSSNNQALSITAPSVQITQPTNHPQKPSETPKSEQNNNHQTPNNPNTAPSKQPIRYQLDLKAFIDHPVQQFLPKTQECAIVTTAINFPSQINLMHIDLDYAFDNNKTQQNHNIDILIKRIQQVQPNVIFLQAFADPDANGSADMVYFNNRHIKVRDDIFNEVVLKIKQQTNVKFVFAWLPLLAWEPQFSPIKWVKHAQKGTFGYKRLTPFNLDNLKMISEIYQDFAQKYPIDGIIYHDDITLNDHEDYHEEAIKTYQKWGYSEKYVTDPIQPDQAKFIEKKIQYLDQLAYAMTQIVKCYQPHIKTAKNTYAPVTSNEKSALWITQSVTSTLKYYDFNAIMAMPYMEQAQDHQQFYQQLIQASKQYDPKLSRTIFELQAVDWNKNQPIDAQDIFKTIKFLRQQGVQHLGYYPDNYMNQTPDANVIKSAFQLKP